jgi:hypothetical protein
MKSILTAAEKNAAKQCKAERADDPVASKETYGENQNGKNAFGRCVTRKTRGS